MLMQEAQRLQAQSQQTRAPAPVEDAPRDPEINGWPRSMFHSDEQWRDWANTRVSRDEYDRAIAFVLRHGQHAMLRVRQGDSSTRIDLDALEDFK